MGNQQRSRSKTKHVATSWILCNALTFVSGPLEKHRNCPLWPVGPLIWKSSDLLLFPFHHLLCLCESVFVGDRSMSSLYQTPTWSQDAEKATGEALLSMSEGTGPTFHQAVEWFKGRENEGNFSLSDVWGVITCRMKGVSVSIKVLQRLPGRKFAYA